MLNYFLQARLLMMMFVGIALISVQPLYAQEMAKLEKDATQEASSEAELVQVRRKVIPLSDNQLKREKWYYSLKEARSERDQVYKLSLKEEKLERFPKDILLFPNLQMLDLSYNKIKEVPKEISRLEKLQSLNLYKNKLQTLPTELKDLPHLTHLYLGRNRLTEVPAWLGGLGKLRVMDVSYNFLTDFEIRKVQELLPRCRVTN